MTPKQGMLLRRLHNNGGSIIGADLDRAMRSIASNMRIVGWVKWECPKGVRTTRNLDQWRLHITDKGRNMIGAEPKP